MKITKSRLKEIIKDVLKEESEYQKFFKTALEKAGKSITSMSDEEKKKFFKFDIDPFRKKCLLKGLDDIALTLKKSNKINDYEAQLEKDKPWIAHQG